MGILRITLQISPDSEQKKIINNMFLGPEKLFSLLSNEESFPKEKADIQLFLLKNRVELYPYICDDIKSNMDALASSLKVIVDREDKIPRLDFYGRWNINTNGFFQFPASRVGAVPFASEHDTRTAQLERSRINQSSRPGCAIVKDGKILLVEFQLDTSMIGSTDKLNHRSSSQEVCKSSHEVSSEVINNKKIRDLKNKAKSYANPAKVYFCKPNLSNSLNCSASEERVLKAVELGSVCKRHREAKIERGGSIWAVPGGLPGLGKRSR